MRKFLTAEEVAELLSVSLKTLGDWRKRGRGPTFIRAERNIRYPSDALEAWLDANTVTFDGGASA